MKRLSSLLSIAVLLAGSVALAADAKPESTKGWIVDSFCGAKNANAAGADCVRDCHKKGAKLELVAGDKTLQLSDQTKAEAHIGHEVVVTGTIDKDTIKVDKIEAAPKG